MNLDWFDPWSEKHMKRFGLTDVEQVSEWAEEFSRRSVTEYEAEDASRHLLATNPPYKNKHLAALLGRIREVRQESIRSSGVETEWPPCNLCSTTGFVIVPLPADIVNGIWGERYTGTVTCRCGLGRWHKDRLPDTKRRMLTIDEFERRYQFWREMLEEKRRRAL